MATVETNVMKDYKDETILSVKASSQSALLHRDVHHPSPVVTHGQGLHLTTNSNRCIIDATGGAAVSCIGHGDIRVKEAIMQQMGLLDYCHSMIFSCPVAEKLATFLINSTHGKMAKAFILTSGSLVSPSLACSPRRCFDD